MREVKKGWGREVIFADTPAYAGKLLVFDKKGAQFSMHFHKNKDETWYVVDGEFELITLDLKDASQTAHQLGEGEAFHVPPELPHRLKCVSDKGVIIEVSTMDDPDDNYRIAPGDSQND